MTDQDKMRLRVAELIAAATSGAVADSEVLAGQVALHDLGVDSLGWLRLLDALELTYGVEIDLASVDLHTATVDTIVGRVQAG